MHCYLPYHIIKHIFLNVKSQLQLHKPTLSNVKWMYFGRKCPKLQRANAVAEFQTFWHFYRTEKQKKLPHLIHLNQGPKGMPDQEISVQNKDKQPKNLRK